MLLEKTVEFVAGLKAECLTQFRLSQEPALKLLQCKRLQNTPRNIGSLSGETAGLRLRNFYCQVHSFDVARTGVPVKNAITRSTDRHSIALTRRQK